MKGVFDEVNHASSLNIRKFVVSTDLLNMGNIHNKSSLFDDNKRTSKVNKIHPRFYHRLDILFIVSKVRRFISKV